MSMITPMSEPAGAAPVVEALARLATEMFNALPGSTPPGNVPVNALAAGFGAPPPSAPLPQVPPLSASLPGEAELLTLLGRLVPSPAAARVPAAQSATSYYFLTDKQEARPNLPEAHPAFDVGAIRRDFPILNETVLFVESILKQPSFEAAVFHRISARLKTDMVGLDLLVATWARATTIDPDIGRALRADIVAVVERDPACERFLEPFHYFKGFHAIQTHRLGHWLWKNEERDFALYLQSRSSDVFQTDIRPAAQFGRGIFLDHATGLVVGETAVVEDGVSLLQNVTLGGTGKESGDRHPKIRQGAMIGAGAKILGSIEIGAHARIAAGSVVLRSVAANATAAGVPAKVVKIADHADASRSLDQVLSDLSYCAFDYSI